MQYPNIRSMLAPRSLLAVTHGLALGFGALAGIKSFAADGDPTPAQIAETAAALPDPAKMTPFSKQVPVIFVTRDPRKPEAWNNLKEFWNKWKVDSVDPATGEKVTRDAVFIKVPLGLNSAPPVPPENPLTEEKVMLGKKLYFDTVISSNNKVSCASCHNPALGYTDQMKTSTGIFDQKGGMNAPTVYNSGYHLLQFWNGRAPTLEDQAQGPPQNPVEMHDGKGNPWYQVVSRLRKNPEYVEAFAKVFGTPPTRDGAAKAIAAYERLALTGNSLVDRAELAMRTRVEEEGEGKPETNAGDFTKVLKAAFEAKDTEALGALGLQAGKDEGKIAEVAASIQRGKELFSNKARCNSCHVGDNYSDSQFHNLGVGAKDGAWPANADLGRFGAQETGHKDPTLVGAYKTPGLRQLVSTAPYMHDGSEGTLEAVIALYNKGGNLNPHLSNKMRDEPAEREAAKNGQKAVIPRKLNLTKQEEADLVLFLKALQGDPAPDIIAKP